MSAHFHRPHARPYRRRAAADADTGSATVELVVLTPVIVILLLLVVGLGRFAYSKELLERAALSAARAASLSAGPMQAGERAQEAARADLQGAGQSCQAVTVATDAGTFTAGGSVTVVVSCTANLADTVLAGLPGSATMSATATVPLELFRQYTRPPR